MKKMSRSHFRIFSVLLFVSITLLSSFSSALAQDFTFVSMADARGNFNGVNKPILEKIVAGVVRQNPQLVVFAGDIIIGSGKFDVFKTQVDNFMQIMKPISSLCPIYYTFGNHECTSNEYEQYMVKYFNNPVDTEGRYKGFFYSFDKENCHFVVIATSLHDEKNKISAEQMRLLELDLIKNKNAGHIFVVGHSPAYPAGPHIGSSLDIDKASRDRFWSLLEKYKVDAYICGHEHLYDRKLQGTVYQLITGTCGAPFANKSAGSFFHFAKFEVSGPDVKVTVYDDNNKIRDQFNYSKRVLRQMHNSINE